MLRVPLMYRQSGGQDEDWFSVPGFTIATEGVPRVPYAPERRRESVFYKADQVLTALPPAFFYAQAPCFHVLPPGFGTARLPSAIAGLVAIWLVYRLALMLVGDETTAVAAAALYSLSRVFYFPATMARPDMLCGMFGLAALCATLNWSRRPTLLRLVSSGVLCGLGLLTHPFAIVFCLQIGVWVMWRSPDWRRSLLHGALLTAAALIVLSAWLPLILMDTDAFRHQFIDNVFDRPEPGTLWRILWPWPYLPHQVELVGERTGTWQGLLMLAGLVFIAWDAVRRRSPGTVLLAWLTFSSLYLMVACLGLHASKGYWCYPGALVMICVAGTLSRLSELLFRRLRYRAVVWSAAVLVMLPGLGLRTWVAHVRHWNDPNYDSRRFTRLLMERFPQEERLAVDPAYVFDAWLLHRNVILGVEAERYFEVGQFDFDKLIVARYGFDNDLPDRLGTTLVSRFGAKDDLFACYAEVYEPSLEEVSEANSDDNSDGDP